jgi:hypothetical protein
MQMQNNLAKLISMVFNPLVVLVPVPFFLVLERTNSLSAAIGWTIFSLAFVGIYSVFILVGIKLKLFSDLDISNQKQRPLLFGVGIILTLIYLGSLFIFRAPSILALGAIAIILGVAVLGFVNSYTKASGHLAVLSAFLTFLALAEGWQFLLSFILLPVVAWARIKTRNHTLFQTELGTFIGIATTFTVYVIVKYIAR